jgi:hypothetical protein
VVIKGYFQYSETDGLEKFRSSQLVAR